MKATKIIGIVLIALSIYLGYLGINKVSNNTSEINFLGIEIDASNESGQNQGFIFLGLAGVLLLGGVYTVKK
ncbi:hypothetical protein FIA58_014425 [Flavobacterium jejuense]|uniref:Arginyl-tRNA synthetase n=1 Tax=Flavobacterium jejuense TaxID=1544455 RepID=A0ABX0IVS9_9FLAO|nr:DUF5963 family protein [Flavobacterium jejuense]NHN26877.1 hypothetical protein [Flavobacterium jejuense]